MAKKNKLSNAVVTATPSNKDDDLKWRAKDALHTMKRAEEIKKDKPLMKAMKQCAREEMKALKKVC